MISGKYFNEVEGDFKKLIIIFWFDDSVFFFIYNV